MKRHIHLYVHCSVVYKSQDRKQPKCPSIGDWIQKPWYVCAVECYLAVKKNEIFPFATTWMDLEGIRLSEVRQKDKYHIISLKWNLEYKKNEQTYRYRGAY